jgi:hypothetical protein
VNWLKLTIIWVEKENPGEIKYKYNIDDPEFVIINAQKKLKKECRCLMDKLLSTQSTWQGIQSQKQRKQICFHFVKQRSYLNVCTDFMKTYLVPKMPESLSVKLRKQMMNCRSEIADPH